MKQIQNTINTIINQIEHDACQTVHKTAQEVADILLNISNANSSENSESNRDNAQLATVGLSKEPLLDFGTLDDTLSTANSTWNVEYYWPIYSHRKVIGKAIVFFKRVFRKIAKFLIEPILLLQNSFNASAVKSLNIYRNGFVMTSVKINGLIDSKNEIEKHIGDITAQLIENKNESQKRIEELQVISEKRLEEIREISEKRIEELQETIELLVSQNKELSAKIEFFNDKFNKDIDVDYFKLENHFRGSREEIKKRLDQYVPHFNGCHNVVDLGSGRGEFVEILSEKGINALGVEPYKMFADYCTTKNIRVENTDALSYLEKQKDCSHDGITAFQMIEHISAADLVILCKECYRVLDYGKTLIFETPNPACLTTFTNSFYIDPTHKNPLHPEYVKYLLEEAGFSDVRIVKPESSENYRFPLLDASAGNLAEFNDGINCLSDIMFGGQDYAVIAVK